MARRIVTSVARREGKTFTIMFSRQMGKNETSAQLEAYLLALYARQGGNIVKAAPSFKPQIVNSILRLKETLNNSPTTRNRWRPMFGYMLALGTAYCTFLSADAHANVVGATASLLLEIDEAQDVDPEKYDRDFRPMASSTNATTVMYGTAWATDSLLERQRLHNLEHEARTGEKLHYEYDWTVLAALNPYYRSFVEGEISRLGLDHPSIQTQYLLQCIPDAGKLFSEAQQAQLRGTHPRERRAQPGATYVAGIDIAGEDEQGNDAASRLANPRKDSTWITIARLSRDANGSPLATVVEHIWWTGRDQVWQWETLDQLWAEWHFSLVSIDATGIGSGVASYLKSRHGDAVDDVLFTQPAKSQLAYSMLAMINTERLSVYAHDDSPESREFWREVSITRYDTGARDIMRWFVPDTEGHDDAVISLGLLARAAEQAPPPPHGTLLRAQPDELHERW